jgi:hypothetical protein
VSSLIDPAAHGRRIDPRMDLLLLLLLMLLLIDGIGAAISLTKSTWLALRYAPALRGIAIIW